MMMHSVDPVGVQNGPEAQMRSLDILCVDPERGMRRLLTVGLGSFGYQVLTASSGQDALDLVARRLPAAIILETELDNLVANPRGLAQRPPDFRAMTARVLVGGPIRVGDAVRALA